MLHADAILSVEWLMLAKSSASHSCNVKGVWRECRNWFRSVAVLSTVIAVWESLGVDQSISSPCGSKP